MGPCLPCGISMKNKLLTLLLGLMAFVFSHPGYALEITNVAHSRTYLIPENDEYVEVNFSLSAAAEVHLNIFDARDILIRKIKSAGPLSPGNHSLVWDGRDQRQRIVPAEAYRYTLTALVQDKQLAEYDLSDITGGKPLDSQAVLDKKNGKIKYQLPEMARVNIRVGLKNRGPMLHTLLNWQPRLAGNNIQAWNGKDKSGHLNLLNHKELDLIINAFSLSLNTIIVGSQLRNKPFINDLSWGTIKRSKKATPKKRMYAYSQQAVETMQDFPLIFKLKNNYEENEQGEPIVSGNVALVLDLPKDVLSHVYNQRFESVFYLDGRFIDESEVGMIPMTWYWDASNVNPGAHYITVNIRGYEGNFGTNTIKVIVK